MYSVYQLKVGEDKVYYGMTKNPKKRLQTHEKLSRDGNKDPLYKAMAENDYTMSVIVSGINKKDALLFEDMLIRTARKLCMLKVLNKANSGARPFADCPEVINTMSIAHKELMKNRPDLCEAQSIRAKEHMVKRIAAGWKPNITTEAHNRQVEARKLTVAKKPEITESAIKVLDRVRDKAMQKIMRPIINLDSSEIFSSITAASKSVGCNPSSLIESVRDGRKCKGQMFVRLYTGTI